MLPETLIAPTFEQLSKKSRMIRFSLLPLILNLGSLWTSGQTAKSVPADDQTLFVGMASSPGDENSEKIRLSGLIQEHPDDADLWLQLGILQDRLHDFVSAEQSLRQALVLNPRLARAHYQLGLTLIGNPRERMDWTAAIGEFRAALKIEPTYPDSLNYLGVGLTAIGQNDEAVQVLSHAVSLSPKQASIRFNYGLALEAVGNHKEAIVQYRVATELRPNFAAANSALGKLLLRAGDYDSAERALRESLRENPDLQDAHYALSQVLRSKSDQEGAKSEAEISLSLGKREPNGVASAKLSNDALQEAASGNLNKAVTMLREAIVLRPDYGVPHYNLGLILADLQQWDDAASQLIQAISLMPGQARPWFDLGRVVRRQGKIEEARGYLHWAAGLAPGDRSIQAELVSLGPSKLPSTQRLTSLQDRPELDGSVNTLESHRSYAEHLKDRGDVQGEIGQRLTVLLFSPASVNQRLLLANAYERSKAKKKAAEEYQKILLIDPANSLARQALDANRTP